MPFSSVITDVIVVLVANSFRLHHATSRHLENLNSETRRDSEFRDTDRNPARVSYSELTLTFHMSIGNHIILSVIWNK